MCIMAMRVLVLLKIVLFFFFFLALPHLTFFLQFLKSWEWFILAFVSLFVDAIAKLIMSVLWEVWVHCP